jgi:hypothetical protein
VVVSEIALRAFTPAEAAELLSVRESWLRRRAGERAVPSRMLGKHLRFTAADIAAIIAEAARPALPENASAGGPDTLAPPYREGPVAEPAVTRHRRPAARPR